MSKSWNGLFFPSPLARLYPHCLIFLHANLGIDMMVMYNISIAYVIQNVSGIFLTNHARVIAVMILSQLEDV
jgi:hypothetical protein